MKFTANERSILKLRKLNWHDQLMGFTFGHMCLKFVFKSLLISLAFILLSCKKAGPVEPFESVPMLYDVLPGFVDEASGIGDSFSNPGFLWVELDSGNPPALYLLKHNGTHGKRIFLKGASNRDWEDLVVSNGPAASKKYIYIGEIGDNNLAYSQYCIYRLPEPDGSADSVSNFARIDFKYPDGAHDAEAMLVDGETKDIYIITKRDQYSKVYKLSYPQDTAGLNMASFVMDLPYRGVVSAGIALSQNELFVKTYSSVYYYKRKNGETIELTLKQPYQLLTYQVEGQGEAICFANDNSGFYTLSEKSFLPAVKLNFYKRK